MKIEGVIVPLVTPYKDGKLDLVSYERMVNHYINEGVNGVMPLATTGETPTLTSDEYEILTEKTMEVVSGRVPVYIGLGGNNTHEVVKKLKIAEKNNVNGILSVCPYYNRPDQRGLYNHFINIAESTDLDIIIYNIPYRTGCNMANETVHRLSEQKNIIGIKDASGDMKQSLDLLMNKPKDFSVLTGEDAYFYTSLVNGADGGVMASAHLRTKDFIEVYNNVRNNNHKEALKKWKELYKFIPLLFKEPNPTPVKYCLERLGIIDSAEVRLPLVPITKELELELDKIILNIV